MTSYPRGSEWRRWDTHVHTPMSILNNQFPRLPGTSEPDWDQYVTALEQRGMAVYGITDYFTIEGYKTLLPYQAAGRLQGIRLLPSIEFRLDKLVSGRGADLPKRLNFHVIFSEEVLAQDIEDHFLHDLNFAYENNPHDTGQQFRLKPANLALLGERLKAEEKSFEAMTPIEVGAMSAVVNLDAIVKILTDNDRFKNKYLLALPAEHWDSIPWGGQDHHTRKLLLQRADLVMASNPKTVSWCMGQPPYMEGPTSFVREFRTLKPCIHGSDAHDLFFIGHPCARRSDASHDCHSQTGQCELRNCWVKADPTFEGLRQLLYEPADRVRIQPADPTPTKSIYSLAGTAVQHRQINDDLALADVDLPLNAGLVAVTGGKGSGKTALVDLIAHCYMDRENTSDRNSFVRRVGSEGGGLQVTLTLANGNKFSKTIADGRFIEDSHIVYIAQGELEKYIDENSDLNEYIHRLVFESSVIKDTTLAFDYQQVTSEIEALQSDLDSLNDIAVQLEQATDASMFESVVKTGKQVKAELEDLEKRVAALEPKLGPEKIAASTKAQEVIAELKSNRDRLVTARDLVSATLRSVDTDLARVAATIAQLNEIITTLHLGSPLTLPTYPDRDRILEIRTAVEAQLRKIVAEIEQREKLVKALADETREHNRLLGKRQELKTRYTQLQQQWKSLDEQKKLLGEKTQERSKVMRKLLETVVSKRTLYTNIISAFGAAKEAILSDLDFVAHMAVEAEALREGMQDLVDNRQVQVEDTEKGPCVFASLLHILEEVCAGDAQAIDRAVAETNTLASSLRTKLKKSKAVSCDELYRNLYRPYLSVYAVALYKHTPLDRLSLGQKATVLMKIYLAEGESPIIIDSHDDHLDNEYIMDELVGAIRQAKEYRQVIIASNNGNVVINSDAEQVIVAQRHDGEISYVAGAIEDPPIRELALKVLEGGPEAFRKRQEKYRIMGGR